ncbi:PREDICTED: probable RNA polymerase II nuclear localization protein SLC7A6OS isoform X2 [Lepidothrix coronata]|uniref:Probable RNA polymerase II nuclear localization protein SLC7A6OS n=1 Tax=Lepidothrix coronata TaxID=321398 RepID=A0A6J0HZK5_9PASS|nr:PREDICTED: probable RNA polymerase II nuclear localization protein SLC7A6OS isoform X2 [Lepidothrix coronata]
MSSAAVLRVRRKRGGPEPAEALLLACKRRREEPPERSLFKLVATVSSKNEPVQKYVKDAITRDRAAQSLRPPVGSTQRILQELQPPVGSTQRILQELQPPVGSTQRILQELQPPVGSTQRILQELQPPVGSTQRILQELQPPVGSTQRILQELQPPVGSTQRILQELQPPVGSTQRILQELRSSRQEKRKENRYRVIASHRPACAETAVPATGAGADADGHGAGSGAQEDASQGESGAADKSSDCCGKFQLFDIVQEEEMVGDCSVTSANPQKIDPDVILCNAVEMIRERLNVSEDAKKHCEKEDEYVYDIYYKETSAPGWIANILSVQPCREEYEWVNDDPVPEEVYEDEDDENDENNWRNDYPEEDEFLPEEDGEKEPEESSSDEEQYYRRRTWDKYRQEVLQEFGYDEMEDLGSD